MEKKGWLYDLSLDRICNLPFLQVRQTDRLSKTVSV